MPRYPEEFIEKIKNKIDIVDLIGSYVSVQRKGRDYWACCPFHNEKTPSFQIRSDHQFYKCYGCQKKGDVINFIRDYEKVSFNEAVEILAKRAGLDLPELVYDPVAKAQKELLEKIYNVNREAARFYYNNIFTDEGKIVREYFAERKLDPKTINIFGMGYSIDFTSLPKFLLDKGYDKQTLLDAGIVSLDKSGELIDFFGKRMVIPIIGGNGKVLGFTGRVLEAKPNFAKYKNTVATLAFHKRKNLFGINLFKKLNQGENRAMILVEGHMDVISLYQAGIQNVVASMGTSLTIEQCREIKRYADIVYVSYDGDSAGQNATLRGLDMLRNEGLDVKVVCLTDNLDPDDYVKQFGKDGYLKLLNSALPLTDYKLRKVEERFDLNDYDQKVKYAKAAMAVLNESEMVEKEIYSKIIAEKSGLKQEIILQQVEENKQEKSEISQVGVEALQNDDMLKRAEKFIVSAFIYGKSYVELNAIADLKQSFTNKDLSKIIDSYMKIYMEKGVFPKISYMFDLVEDESLAGELIDLVDKIGIAEQENYYKQCINQIKFNYKNKELKRLITELNNVKDESVKYKIKEEIKNLTKAQPK